MKKFATLAFAAAALAVIGSSNAFAAAGAGPVLHSYEFTANDAESIGDNDVPTTPGVGLSAGDLTIPGDVTVNVAPYFLVEGQFGGTFEVEGWGLSTSDPEETTFDIWHNQDFNYDYDGMGNPSNGVDEVDLQVSRTVTSDGAFASNEGFAAASTYNTSSATGPVTLAATQGHINVVHGYKITVDQNDHAGAYTLSPSITFSLPAAP